MKKKRVSLLATLGAALIAACSVFGVGCGQTEGGVDEKLSQAPDYSAYSDLKFESFAYSALNDGKWTLDGEVFDVGEDFHSPARYQEYKEAGFTIYFAGGDTRIEDDFDEEEWLKVKKIMDDAHEAGLKVLVRDLRILNLSMTTNKGVVGEGCRFADEAALDAYIAECAKYYKDHPAFYALMLGDEPFYNRLTAYGQVYKAVRRVLPAIKPTYNLLPMRASQDALQDGRFPEVEGEFNSLIDEACARYAKYLNDFLDATGADNLQYDDYPIHPTGISDTYIRGLQIAAGIAKERGIEFHMVSQTFGLYNNGTLHWRKIEEEDAVWMNNMLLGHGVKQLHYFTYMTRPENKTAGENFIDGASYLTRSGEKTDIYYFMQKIMQQNNKFAPTVLNFDYQGSRSYVKLPTNYPNGYIANVDNSYEFKKISNVTIDKETGYVSELYDSANSRYMYMLMNATSPWNKGSKAYQTTEVTFSSEYTHVAVYKDGVATPQKLNGNKFTVSLGAGEAVFLLPY